MESSGAIDCLELIRHGLPARDRRRSVVVAGAGTVTDLAIRTVFYREHGRDTGRGVLLASYTWSEDAQRWGSLSPADRLAQALENLARIHPRALAEYEVGASKMWHDDEFAGGGVGRQPPELCHAPVRCGSGKSR